MTADIREVVRLLEEGRASGADERQLALSDGRQVRFRRAPTPGLVYSLTVQEAGGREDLLFAQFDAAESRPTDYPPEAPFLPGQPVGVFSPGAGSWVLTWEAVADPAHLVTAVLADNERDGWELQTTPATGGLLPVTLYGLHRGERRRVLSVMSTGPGSVLTLLEAPRSGERDPESASARGGQIGSTP